MNVTDLMILVIIALTVIIGYRKNLFRNSTEFFSLAISLWVSFRYYGGFASIVEKLPGIKGFFNLFQKLLLSKLESFDKEINFTLEGLQRTGMSKEFNFFFKNGSFFKQKDTIVFSELTTGLILNVLSIIILFMLCIFIIRFLSSLYENSSRMPGAIPVERFGGVLFSFLKGLIYAAVIALVVSNISVFFNSGALYDLFYKSKIAMYLYDSGFVGLFFH